MLRAAVLLAIGSLTVLTIGLLPLSHVREASASTAVVFADQPGPSDPELLIRAAGDQRRTVEAAAAAAAAAAAVPPTVPEIITSAFRPLGDTAVTWALQIAFCESTNDPNAVNSASDAEGLFQFLPTTWAGTPFASQSPFDPVANARAAAWLFQTYGASQWECTA